MRQQLIGETTAEVARTRLVDNRAHELSPQGLVGLAAGDKADDVQLGIGAQLSMGGQRGWQLPPSAALKARSAATASAAGRLAKRPKRAVVSASSRRHCRPAPPDHRPESSRRGKSHGDALAVAQPTQAGGGEHHGIHAPARVLGPDLGSTSTWRRRVSTLPRNGLICRPGFIAKS